MKELLSLDSTSDVQPPQEREPKLVDIDEAEADTVFSVLSSETAREILKRIYEEPRTASELATHVETSIQNTNYHLNKLQAAEFIYVVDTRYSEQGREMSVYAPANGPLLVYAGAEPAQRSLSLVLKRLFGATGLLAFVSLGINRIQFESEPRLVTTDGPNDSVVVGDSPNSAFRFVTELLSTPGGILFAVGAILVVTLFVVWYLRWYRPNAVVVS